MTKGTIALFAAGLLALGGAVGSAGSAPSAAASAPTAVAASNTASVNQASVDQIRYNREEERMARDLYTALAEKHNGARPMSNIARSEQRHFDAVGTLLSMYHIDDPSEGLAPGTYAFPDIQAAYDDWLARGSVNLAGAYQVGIELEREDIDSLTKGIQIVSTDYAKQVLTNLRSGSENHLAAYERAAAGQTAQGGQARQGKGQGQRGQGRQNQAPGANRGPGRGAGQAQGPRDGSGPGSGTGDNTCTGDGVPARDGSGRTDGRGKGQTQGKREGSGRADGQGKGTGAGARDGSGPRSATGDCVRS